MKKELIGILVCILLIAIAVLPVSGTINDDQIVLQKPQTIMEKMSFNSQGNTLYVGGSGPNNYTKIQDAINDSKNGDTVFVYDDLSPYYEHVFVNKAITLRGEDKNTTIIDGSEVDDVIYISANNVIINGFTIQNSGDEGWENHWDGGIDIRSRNCIISDNIIMYNFYGIVSIDGINHTFSYNTFYKNSASIQLWDDGENNIFGNTIKNYGGIRFNSPSKYNNISNNVIDTVGCGMMVGSSYNTISKNTLIHNGFYFSASDNNVFDNTVNGKPLIYMEKESNQIISESAGQVILQHCDKITIQNQEISSIYVGILLRNTNNSIISNCTLTKNDEASIYLRDSNNNVISNSTLSSNYWLGVWVWFSSNNIFYNNTIKYNKVYGIWLHGSSDNTIIENNYIRGNAQGGICLSEYNRPYYDDIHPNDNIISGNIIKSNIGDGVLLDSSRNSIIGNNISKNRASGIYLFSNQNIISGNTISDNNHDGISLVTGANYNTISGNNITDNDWSGVASIYSFYNIIEDSNLSNNRDSGVFLYCSDKNTITRNTISDNHHDGISLDIESRRSTISGNNITGNNQFGIFASNYSSNNIIYHNNFKNNTAGNAYEYESSNFWYNIWLREGNYWDDYKEKYPNAKPRSLRPYIWDTPYNIPDVNNKDKFPLRNSYPNSYINIHGNQQSRQQSSSQQSSNTLLERLLASRPIFSRILNLR